MCCRVLRSEISPRGGAWSLASNASTVFGSSRFGDGFQTIDSPCNRLQHLEDFPLDAGVANQLWLVHAAVLAEDAAIEGRANSLFHTQNALIEVVGLGSGR